MIFLICYPFLPCCKMPAYVAQNDSYKLWPGNSSAEPRKTLAAFCLAEYMHLEHSLVSWAVHSSFTLKNMLQKIHSGNSCCNKFHKLFYKKIHRENCKEGYSVALGE